MSREFAIITDNLTKNFGNIRAVDNLNIKIPYGKTFGLLGPNGAGKTTIIRILNCIFKPDYGTAKVVGYDIIKDKKNVKMNCGLLPQTPGLYYKLTAKEFLRFIGELYFLPRDVISTRIDNLLEIFQLKKRENDLLEGYSRGMKQKISFCAAIMHDPEILFLDEPTASLDPTSSRMVKDIIASLVKKSKKTIFLSTHLLNVAEELCDMIGIINNGIIEIIGTLDEILNITSSNNLEEVYISILGNNHGFTTENWNI